MFVLLNYSTIFIVFPNNEVLKSHKEFHGLYPNHTAKIYSENVGNHNPLYGLQGILSRKFLSILKKYKVDERGKKYREFYNKIIEKWEHKDDKDKCTTLLNKINEEAALYDAIDTKFHTNYNESFHHIRNKDAPKYTFFGKSWILIICCNNSLESSR